MKTELEVARDAVRSAGLEELADNLEWAAAAVKHRKILLEAARHTAATEARYGGEGFYPCIVCGEAPHRRDCEAATALHALDPEWSREEVERAHVAAWDTLRPVRGLRLHTIDSPTHRALNDALNDAILGSDVTRVRTADGVEYELRRQADGNWRWEAIPSVPASPLMVTQHAYRPLHGPLVDLPQPAQPQPEDEPADE